MSQYVCELPVSPDTARVRVPYIEAAWTLRSYRLLTFLQVGSEDRLATPISPRSSLTLSTSTFALFMSIPLGGNCLLVRCNLSPTATLGSPGFHPGPPTTMPWMLR